MSARRIRAIRLPSVVLCLALGLLTTIGVAWAAAAFVPLAPLNQVVQLPIGFEGQGVHERTSWLLPPTSGTVALDGDHLQPWFLRLERPGAQRTIWFEKGRIYNRAEIGPAGGSSAAVANWSLATSTRSHPRFEQGPLRLPTNLEAEVKADSQEVWGVMEDQRGWPALALKWQAVAPRWEVAERAAAASDEAIYVPRWAINIPEPARASGGLAELRALPFMPVWSGLIIDTLIFGAAWWVVLLAPRPVRAHLRRRRGRCPACAYDLCGDLAGGCPECGWNRGAGTAPRSAAGSAD